MKVQRKNILEKFFAAFNRWFGKVTFGYTRGVGSWIRRTPYVVVMLIVLIVGLFFLFKNKPSGFIPTEDEGRILVTYEMPEGASTARSVELLKMIGDRIKEDP